MADRKSIRYQPDPMTMAYLDFKGDKNFAPSLVGIVLNESFKGCSLVVATDDFIKKDQKVRIKIGQLGALKAQVAWVKNLEENIYKIGIKLLE